MCFENSRISLDSYQIRCFFLFSLRLFHLESNRQICPEKCHCLDDQVDCSYQNLLQIPKHLFFNTASLDLSYNNLTILNVSDLLNYSQLRQLIVNHNKIEKIIDTEVS